MICGEDPPRRRPRKSMSEVETTGELRLNPGKYGQMAFRTQKNRKIRPSDGCGRDTVPLAVKWWYDFPEFGCHLGNVGLTSPPLPDTGPRGTAADRQTWFAPERPDVPDHFGFLVFRFFLMAPGLFTAADFAHLIHSWLSLIRSLQSLIVFVLVFLSFSSTSWQLEV